MTVARHLGSLATAIVLTASASACGASTDDATADGRPDVAAAFYPLAWVTEQVAGDHASVENLTTPGGEPHDLELSIQQTAAVSEAALVVVERGFQPAVDAAVEQNASGEVLDAADVVELRPAEEHDEEGHAEEELSEHGEEHGEEHGNEHGDEHGDLDPHFWLDPLLMADLGDAVADRLAEIDPDRAQDYRANAETLRSDLAVLDEEYVDGLTGCERDTVVVSHDAFGYLSRYGVHLEPIVGVSPDAEPTPAGLAALRELIREEGITTVFTETLVSPKTAEALATEADVETGVLDPIEGLSDESADEDYLSLMRANLTALQEANGC